MKKPQTGAGVAEAFPWRQFFNSNFETLLSFSIAMPLFLEYQVSKFADSHLGGFLSFEIFRRVVERMVFTR